MPTWESTGRFSKDWALLDPSDQARFLRAVRDFAEDLQSGQPRPGLRVKGVQSARGVFEMTWGPDGRATFEFGDELRENEPHIIWRRIRTHDIFGRP